MPISKAIVKDVYLSYQGLAPGSTGLCHLRVIRGELRTAFLVSEVRHNPGPSVTNAIEGIWSAVLASFPQAEWLPDPLLVEHFNDAAVYGTAGREERYAIAYLLPGTTAWKHVTAAEVAILIGCAEEDLHPELKLLIPGTQETFGAQTRSRGRRYP